jgi:hypothetical protein
MMTSNMARFFTPMHLSKQVGLDIFIKAEMVCDMGVV